MTRVFESRAGFALPTILIASMIMLTVLITSVSATSGVRTSLDGQYYAQLAREAAESGLARANGCLQDSGYSPSWSDPGLYPNTSCNGGNPCTNAASCFVTSRPTIRTTFYVGAPENLNVSQIIRSIGKVELLRASTGEVWRSYTYTASARVSVDLSLSTVSFGYTSYGAYFATVLGDGKVRAVGANNYGQLGNGSTSDTLTPTPVNIPSNERATAVFTNFLSQGRNVFTLTASGKLYGAGLNGNGQLGDGTKTSRSTPTQFLLPPGETARHATLNGYATYVITNGNKVYSVGLCDKGMLGYSYTIAGCIDKTTYNEVALPAPNLSNLNTIPTNNIVADYQSVFLRMQGGRVYGWGYNGWGQFGNGGTTDSAVPVQLGDFGNAGEPKAVDIATDGISFWIVDDAGKAWGMGYNEYGSAGGGDISFKVDSLDECVDNTSGNGSTMQFYPCNNSGPQKWTWRTDKSIYNANTAKCLNVAADGATVNLATCNSSNAQKWNFQSNRTIQNVGNTKCLNNQGNDGVSLIVYTCSSSAANNLFTLPPVYTMSTVPLPASAGSAIKISTDQWFTSILTSNGEVWSFGNNNRGQLGNGTTNSWQPYPVKFILPGGVTAKDVYTAANSTTSTPQYNNTFVVGSDGKVYGAGANNFGQLGDGTTTDRSTPVAMQVIDGTNIRAKQVIVGLGTTVVITEDKKVYTLGNNANGQLGDGTTTNSSTPRANRYTNVLPVTSF